MAFKNWQIGLHLQQQAVAVAIVRSAKNAYYTAGGGCHWKNDIVSKMGGLLMCSGWLTRCYRGVVNCRSTSSHYVGVSRQSHITAVISTPVDVPR